MDKKKGQLITVRELIEYYERERPGDTKMILTLRLVERIQSLTKGEKTRIIRALILVLNTNMSTEQAIRRVGL
jgi:hypothetical protein